MTLENDFLTSVQGPGIDDIARLVELLGDAGISSALWGVNAASCYGGGGTLSIGMLSRALRMLAKVYLTDSQNIEIVINEVNQARTFESLCSNGCRPSQLLSDNPAPCLNDFDEWRGLALHYQYHYRRRLRICTPIYELPKTGDAFSDFFLPFIIVYTAELVGLPAVPPPSAIKAYTDSKGEITSQPRDQKHREEAGHQDGKHHRDYVLISSLPHYLLGSHESQSNLLIPDFNRLIQSNLHVLLQLANQSPIWGQYMVQLSELVHSPGCEMGPHSFHDIVKPTQVKFTQWVQLDLKGESDQEVLCKILNEHRGQTVNIGS